MASNADSISRFKLSDTIRTADGKETYGLMKKYKFLDTTNIPTDQIIRVIVDGKTAGKPNIIALNLYSSEMHYWVLLMFNNVIDPFGWPKNGSVVLAPPRDMVLAEL